MAEMIITKEKFEKELNEKEEELRNTDFSQELKVKF